jgi:hypothetical protein
MDDSASIFSSLVVLYFRVFNCESLHTSVDQRELKEIHYELSVRHCEQT